MIHHRYPFISTAILALALVGCALPGLGSHPLSADGPAYDPQIRAENRLTAPAGQPPALTEAIPTVQSQTSAITLAPSQTAARPQTKPTVTPAAPAQPPRLTASSFSLASLEPAPVGILPQVKFFQTGGGSGFNGADCDSRPGELRWCNPLNGADLPLTVEFRGIACGQGSLPLKATLLLPDGTSQPAQVQGEPPFCREISYSPNPNALAGRYRVTVEQSGQVLVDTFQWVRPAHPTGIRFQGCAWLAGLAPNQLVRLLVFGLIPPDSNSSGPDFSLGLWRYLAERRFSVGTDGMLWACPDRAAQESFPELAYLAYLTSGAPLPIGAEDLLKQFQGNCADGPPTHLAVGKSARILAKNLPIFPDPALNERALGTLAAGSKGTILDGPACPPQGPWVWKVSLENGLAGWITESDTTTYFVEPIR